MPGNPRQRERFNDALIGAIRLLHSVGIPALDKQRGIRSYHIMYEPCTDVLCMAVLQSLVVYNTVNRLHSYQKHLINIKELLYTYQCALALILFSNEKCVCMK